MMNNTLGLIEENELKTALHAAYPSDVPSIELRRRIAACADSHGAPSMPNVKRLLVVRYMLAGVSLAALCGMAVFMRPTIVAAQTLHNIDTAMQSVTAAHLVTWGIGKDGRRSKIVEGWYQDGASRSLMGDTVSLFTNQGTWSYDLTLNIVQTEPARQRNSIRFSLSATQRDMNPWKTKIQLLDTSALNGHKVEQYVIDEPDQNDRMLMVVDASTHLPISWERDQKGYHGWVPFSITECNYDAPIAAALFKPQFPANARWIDQARERVRLFQEMHGTNVATVPLGDKQITLRHVEVNTTGTVFVVSTGGELQESEGGVGSTLIPIHERGSELTDSQGTVYVQGPPIYAHYLLPNPTPNPNALPKPGHPVEIPQSAVDNTLNVAVYVPLNPNKTWTPRVYKLTAFNPPIVSGPGLKKWRELELSEGITPTSGTIKLPVSHTSQRALPDYCYEIGAGSYSDIDEFINENIARATYYEQHGDLNQALRWRMAVTEQRDLKSQRTGQTENDSGAWLHVYQLLHELGRETEAQAALEKAKEQDVYFNNHTNIEAASHGLPIDLSNS